MSDWKVFGERLKRELERQEISQRQLADKSGIPLATICRYVHSQRVPRATEILRLAKILHVTCDYMLGLSDDPHKTRDGWTKGAPLHDNGSDYAHGFADGYKNGLKDAEPEIVRCKDCKQFRRWIDTDICFCDITEAEMSDNDFCSRAERRTDEQDSE